jgi:hypothetical protein
MRHKIIDKLADVHPYELLKVELIPEDEKELDFIKNNSVEIENYLIYELDAISVIERKYPFYTMKTLKNNVEI